MRDSMTTHYSAAHDRSTCSACAQQHSAAQQRCNHDVIWHSRRTHCVADVEEAAGLAALAVHRQRVPNRRLQGRSCCQAEAQAVFLPGRHGRLKECHRQREGAGQHVRSAGMPRSATARTQDGHRQAGY
jgi:hypothetical protein